MATIPSIVPLLPPAAAPLRVGAVAAVTPAALASASGEGLPLPVSQPLAPTPAAASAESGSGGAAMRSDQVFMTRQLNFPVADGQSLAASWRAMVRNYDTQLMNRELRSHAGQLPSAVLMANQDGRVLRQPDLSLNLPQDAWRFTVHTGSARDQHLRVVQGEPDRVPGRRRRGRFALRLELELADGTAVVVQVEPMPGGVALELCAHNTLALARLRDVQPMLEEAVARAGLQVLRWRYRDRLPAGPVHARVRSSEAGQVLTLAVFRAAAELALTLPIVEENAKNRPLVK